MFQIVNDLLVETLQVGPFEYDRRYQEDWYHTAHKAHRIENLNTFKKKVDELVERKWHNGVLKTIYPSANWLFDGEGNPLKNLLIARQFKDCRAISWKINKKNFEQVGDEQVGETHITSEPYTYYVWVSPEYKKKRSG